MPTFLIRFTARQLLLLSAGLRQVRWASSSELIKVADDPRTCKCPLCRLHIELLNLILMVDCADGHERYRFHLTIGQILLCQLALRIALNPSKAARQLFAPIVPTCSVTKLGKKLENLRKRAKRQYASGPNGYKAFSDVWHRYLDVLRRTLSGRLPSYLRTDGDGAYRFGKMLIDSLISSVTAEFQKLKFEPPPPQELRSLVRLFLSYVRRGRINLWIRDCARDPAAVAPLLVAFIRKHVNKPNQRTTNPKTKEVSYATTLRAA